VKDSQDRSDLFHILFDQDLHPLSSYKDLLLYYSQKELTKEQDRLNAIAGFFLRLAIRMKCEFLEGLPVATFDAIILFRVTAITDDEPLVERRKHFPSYSWTGWFGIPDWDYVPDFGEERDPIESNKWLDTRTWITWYSRTTDGILELLWDDGAQRAFRDEPSTVLGYRKRNAPPFQNDSQLRLPTKPEKCLSPGRSREYTLLQFWTITALYSLNFDSPTTASILDRYHRPCGRLLLNHELPSTVDRTYEFLVLSESQSPSSIFEDHLKGRPKTSMQHSGDPATPAGLEPWDFYWVVLVIWDGEIAERRGIGQVYQSSLKSSLDPGPEWREIILG